MWLEKHRSFVRIGFADPLKRFCQELFSFSDAQVWGDEKELQDKRYPRPYKLRVTQLDEEGMKKVSVLPLPEPTEAEINAAPKRDGFLTPRYAMQRLGTEWGRDCYDTIWVEYALRVAKKLLKGGFRYMPKDGCIPQWDAFGGRPETPPPGVVFSDVRFRNEFDAIKSADGINIRVIRPGADGSVGISGHASEKEQQGIPNSEFDYVIMNDGTLEQYHQKLDKIFTELLGKV